MKRYIRTEYIPDMTERFPEGMYDNLETSNHRYGEVYDDEAYDDEDGGWDMFKGSKYLVSAAHSNYPGELSSRSEDVITNSPEAAITAWFEINQDFPTETSISTQTKAAACELIDFAAGNIEWILSMCSQYRCHYKPKYLQEAIYKKQADGCRGFYESEFGDMIHPFDIG